MGLEVSYSRLKVSTVWQDLKCRMAVSSKCADRKRLTCELNLRSWNVHQKTNWDSWIYYLCLRCRRSHPVVTEDVLCFRLLSLFFLFLLLCWYCGLPYSITAMPCFLGVKNSFKQFSTCSERLTQLNSTQLNQFWKCSELHDWQKTEIFTFYFSWVVL